MRKCLVWAALFVSVVALAACGDSGSGGGAAAVGSSTNSEFCTTLKNDVALFQKIGNRANAEQITAALSDLTSKAPPELTSDLATMTAAYQGYAQQASATASLGPAFANLTKYAKDACGIDLTNVSTDSSSSSNRGPVN